ncbi:unnamed protein product [Euphydryas editha]|uniref:PDZ domain-containing protein n=1 Tax=Euphydryas editha TaxID=104508 RepID=A0AAU9UMS1_EUPED|nr:unnamed protein product [Euphydryas editha]
MVISEMRRLREEIEERNDYIIFHKGEHIGQKGVGDNQDVPIPGETLSPAKHKKEPTIPIAPKISSPTKRSGVVLSEPGTPTIKLPVSPTKDLAAESQSPSPKPKLSPSKSSSVESRPSSPKPKLSPSKIGKSDVSPIDQPSTSKAWLLPSEAPTRPTTPTPARSSPVSETPPDPATAQIIPNQEVVIEIDSNMEVPGIALLGGSDTFINGPAAVILDIYKGGVIDKDGRLKVGDQIRECNDVVINKDMLYQRVCMSIKPLADKMKLTVYRPEPLEYVVVDAELKRRSKQPWFGINFIGTEHGVYISEIMGKSSADETEKLQRGDFLLAIDGDDVSKKSPVEIDIIFKYHLINKSKSITIRVKRFKIIPKEEL